MSDEQRHKYVPPPKRPEAGSLKNKRTVTSESPRKKVRIETPEGSSESESDTDEEVPHTPDRPFARIKPMDIRPIQGTTGSRLIEPMQKNLREAQVDKGKDKASRPDQLRMGLAEEIADRIMDSPVTLRVDELTKVSPTVLKVLNRRTKNRRIPVRALGTHMVVVKDEDNPLDKHIMEEELQPHPCLYVDTKDMASSGEFEVLQQEENGLPKGSVVQRDITEQFKADLPLEDRKKIIIVASRSEGLRVAFPKINNTDLDVEVVLDSGSQIVSVATEVASALGLSWDPDVIIHMQSANGQLQPTKGLARNVPFKFGELTVYLQLHVIDNPPYQVLLGRPFDSLTESTVQNYANGDQDVTITCPNTRYRCTIGTFTRGKPRMVHPRGIDPTMKEELAQPNKQGTNETVPDQHLK
ncbi:hypothetical protein VKT23_003921 [Stygiomarasmius scandens]|uniref:Uncharacterized protein n=1 Tax=Marasmiellus scandens TaxID=2682957 RepID=A0ABR1IT03_9AGAR